MIQLGGFTGSSFGGNVPSLEPELEAMLAKTLSRGETIYLKIQSAPGEAFVLTRFRVIILKSARKDINGRGYGRFFSLDNIIRFEYRGWLTTTFIAVITRETEAEAIPSLNVWKCSFGVTFAKLGAETRAYLTRLESWLAMQRRNALLHAPLQSIVPSIVAVRAGENFYLEVPAAYYEEKAFRRYVGGSSGVSVPVFGGIRVRVGNYRGYSTTQSVLQEDDKGLLTVGDQRIVFSGSRRNISIPLSTIVSVQAFTNGVQLGSGNKNATQFRTEDDMPGLLIKRLLNVP